MGKMKDFLIIKQEALADKYNISFDEVCYILNRLDDPETIEKVFADPKLLHIMLASYHIEETIYNYIITEQGGTNYETESK